MGDSVSYTCPSPSTIDTRITEQNVSGVNLIDFSDMNQINQSITINSNGKQITNEIESRSKVELSVLSDLIEKENPCHYDARHNLTQYNATDQDSQIPDIEIQKNCLFGSTKCKRPASPSLPPSNNFCADDGPNLPPNIKYPRVLSNDSVSDKGNYKQFELPPVSSITNAQSSTERFARASKRIKIIKHKRCYKCSKIVENLIQLNCQHTFCCQCLVDSFTNLENAHCPFTNQNYICNNILKMHDIQFILEATDKSLDEPGPSRAHVEENFFYRNIDDSKEVLLYCKKPNCKAFWFVDKTEGENTYICPVCEAYNCFKCRTIHHNMTCVEFNHGDPNASKWKCESCKYSDNLMNTATCVICSQINQTIIKQPKVITSEYYRLLDLEKKENFVPNFDEFECVICMEQIKPDDGVQIRGCLHNICKICIRKYIEIQDQPEIKCPFTGCINNLEDREIKSLISPQAYDRHLAISLRVGKTQIKNGYQCCVTNCQGWWIFSEGIYDYNCPVCNTENCISCKASHPGNDCKAYQTNLLYSTDKNCIETRQNLEQMLKSGKAEHCPKCNVIIVKIDGCNEMRCSMCHGNFKWGSHKRNTNLNLK